jgi:hypothetical protein
MPRATVNQETVRKELKSCPDGYVELRALSFDQLLERRDKAMKMYSSGDQKDSRVIFESAMQWSRYFEFKNCIVDHNLEADNGEKLNFENPMTLKILDPKIGSEIERYIDEMNQEEGEESYEDFSKRVASSSTNGQTTPSPDSDSS